MSDIIPAKNNKIEGEWSIFTLEQGPQLVARIFLIRAGINILLSDKESLKIKNKKLSLNEELRMILRELDV